MMIMENYHRNVPEYYKTMYLDGYTPEQIFYANRQRMLNEQEELGIPEVKITYEVKIR